MKYKTLFRVLLKVVGVWLGITGLINVVEALCYALIWYLDSGSFGTSFGFAGTYLAGGLLEFVAGLYLFFGGKWIVNRAIPGNRPYCPECGYDLTGNKSGHCTECGTAIPSDESRVEHHNDESRGNPENPL